MCAFSFTVFLSAFQLLPVAPYRILSLGGTAAVAGLFLGFLTYSSAGTAPLTGALVDRFGPRQVLIVASLAITGFSLVYAVLPTYPLMLGLVIVHGFFWSGLLSSSATYVTALVPATRRAEGMGYWGLSTVLAVSVAPTIGLWVYSHGGWTAMCLEAAALNLVMAAIAWTLPADANRRHSPHHVTLRSLLEWRVLILSFTLFLYAFGYGGLTSFVALYTDRHGVTPRALYFTLFSLTIVCDAPVHRPLHRPGRLPTRLSSVCGADRSGFCIAGGGRHPSGPDPFSDHLRGWVRLCVSRVSGARAAILWTRIGGVPRLAASSAPSTPALVRVRSRWVGLSNILASARPGQPPPVWPRSPFRSSSSSNGGCWALRRASRGDARTSASVRIALICSSNQRCNTSTSVEAG